MRVFARHLMLATLVLGLVLAAGSQRTVVGHHRAAAQVVGPSVPAPPHRAGPLVGIAEQKPTMFASRAWQRLGVVDARYTTPWDALDDPQQLALLDQ
jgi:hypothetical protein